MTGADAGYSREELLISAIVDLLGDERHIAVGAASPIPGAAALLAQREARARGRRLHVTVLHSQRHNRFTDGARELFDCAAQGRVDVFFLGGVQIDGDGNINLVGVGDYPQMKKRFPGSFGSALMYYVVPKVILFREEHTPRTLVGKVDFVSAPGRSADNVYRPGGPRALVTGRCVFGFDRTHGFRLDSLHPGETAAGVRGATGFDYRQSGGDGGPPPTAPPSPQRLALLRDEVASQVADFYPQFAERVWGAAV